MVLSWLLSRNSARYLALSGARSVDGNRAFGLCDLGLGCPDLGYGSLSELAEVRGPFTLPVERDLHFIPAKTLSGYADEARAAQSELDARRASSTLRVRFRSHLLHRPPHPFGDEFRERLDFHVDAGAIQRRQIDLTILNPDDRPGIAA